MTTAAKFPAAVVTLANLLGEFPNFPEAVLSGAHNNSVTTITLTATVNTAWPTTAGAVTIDSEIIAYTGVSGATLTGCTRASQGTSAASHNDLAKVGLYLTAATVNQILAEIIETQTLMVKGADIASAATLVPGTDGSYFHVTGVTGITAITPNPAWKAGLLLRLEFDGAVLLTHNATSLIMRSGQNALTAAGDVYTFVSEGSGNWRELWHLTASNEPNRASVYRVTDDFGTGKGAVATGSTAIPTIAGLNWWLVAIGTTETAVFLTSVAGHPGIFELDTSATTTLAIELYSNGNGAWLLPSDTFDSTWVIRPNATVDANMVFRFGLTDTQTAPTSGMTAPSNGIYVEKLTGDTQYFGVCRSGGVQTRTAAFGSVTNGTWTKFRIRRVDASTIGFTQDAGAEVTLTTNIPTAAMFSHIAIGNNSTANSKKLDIDLYDMQVTSLTR